MKCVGDILGTEFCWPKEKEMSILATDVRHFDVVKKV